MEKATLFRLATLLTLATLAILSILIAVITRTLICESLLSVPTGMCFHNRTAGTICASSKRSVGYLQTNLTLQGVRGS